MIVKLKTVPIVTPTISPGTELLCMYDCVYTHDCEWMRIRGWGNHSLTFCACSNWWTSWFVLHKFNCEGMHDSTSIIANNARIHSTRISASIRNLNVRGISTSSDLNILWWEHHLIISYSNSGETSLSKNYNFIMVLIIIIHVSNMWPATRKGTSFMQWKIVLIYSLKQQCPTYTHVKICEYAHINVQTQTWSGLHNIVHYMVHATCYTLQIKYSIQVHGTFSHIWSHIPIVQSVDVHPSPKLCLVEVFHRLCIQWKWVLQLVDLEWYKHQWYEAWLRKHCYEILGTNQMIIILCMLTAEIKFLWWICGVWQVTQYTRSSTIVKTLIAFRDILNGNLHGIHSKI